MLLQNVIKPVCSKKLTETSRDGLEERLAQDGDESQVARDACPGDQIHIGSGISTDEQDEITFNLEKGLSQLLTQPCEDGGGRLSAMSPKQAADQQEDICHTGLKPGQDKQMTITSRGG